MARKCHKGIVSFKTKRGKTISFRGNIGSGCPARKKPSTRHLAAYKKDLAQAARKCKGRSRKAFLSCVSNNTKAQELRFSRKRARAMRR